MGSVISVCFLALGRNQIVPFLYFTKHSCMARLSRPSDAGPPIRHIVDVDTIYGALSSVKMMISSEVGVGLADEMPTKARAASTIANFIWPVFEMLDMKSEQSAPFIYTLLRAYHLSPLGFRRTRMLTPFRLDPPVLDSEVQPFANALISFSSAGECIFSAEKRTSRLHGIM